MQFERTRTISRAGKEWDEKRQTAMCSVEGCGDIVFCGTCDRCSDHCLQLCNYVTWIDDLPVTCDNTQLCVCARCHVHCSCSDTTHEHGHSGDVYLPNADVAYWDVEPKEIGGGTGRLELKGRSLVHSCRGVNRVVFSTRDLLNLPWSSFKHTRWLGSASKARGVFREMLRLVEDGQVSLSGVGGESQGAVRVLVDCPIPYFGGKVPMGMSVLEGDDSRLRAIETLLTGGTVAVRVKYGSVLVPSVESRTCRERFTELPWEVRAGAWRRRPVGFEGDGQLVRISGLEQTVIPVYIGKRDLVLGGKLRVDVEAMKRYANMGVPYGTYGFTTGIEYVDSTTRTTRDSVDIVIKQDISGYGGRVVERLSSLKLSEILRIVRPRTESVGQGKVDLLATGRSIGLDACSMLRALSDYRFCSMMTRDTGCYVKLQGARIYDREGGIAAKPVRVSELVGHILQETGDGRYLEVMSQKVVYYNGDHLSVAVGDQSKVNYPGDTLVNGDVPEHARTDAGTGGHAAISRGAYMLYSVGGLDDEWPSTKVYSSY